MMLSWVRSSAAPLNDTPLVSVLIPTHNRVDLLLSRALPSVLSQTYTNLEIIVAAHGCTDGTEKKAIEALGCRSLHLRAWLTRRVLHVPRRQTYPPTAENHWLTGPVAPLNAALKVCKGEWIARIDDDDTWTPDHVEKLLRFAQERSYEFVSSAHETHEGKVLPYDLDGTKVGATQTWLYRSYLKMFRYNPSCWRKSWNRVNDTDLQDRMWKSGVRMGYIDEVTAHVLPRPGERQVGLAAYLSDKHKALNQFAFE